MSQNKPTRPCNNCASEIDTRAVKCTYCDTWQNWRGYLNFSVPVLSLLLAILSVTFSSGREFYEYITSTPNVHVHFGKFDIDEEPALASRWIGLSITLVNNEPDATVWRNHAVCLNNERTFTFKHGWADNVILEADRTTDESFRVYLNDEIKEYFSAAKPPVLDCTFSFAFGEVDYEKTLAGLPVTVDFESKGAGR